MALEHLFKRYQRPLYQTALGITHDAELAEEIVQDCFYRLYRYAGRLDESLPLAPWLYRVLINLCYSRLKRRRFWSEPFHKLAGRLRAGPGSAPEHIVERREVHELVRETLRELSPHHRAVLVLHYFQDYSVAEIAEILQCSEGTVKSRLHHARRLLKQRLSKELDLFANVFSNQF